jgi:hypothetical protein
MKKFIITEEEKSRILSLYEKVGDPLTSQALSSPKAQTTKTYAQFLNNYYKLNLSSAKTGNWNDKDYNDTLKKFMEEKGVPVWVCKTGDGYCGDGDDGQVVANGSENIKKLHDLITGQQTSTEEKINTTHDDSYDYKLSGGKYYYSKKGQNKWIEAKGKSLESIKSKVKF